MLGVGGWVAGAGEAGCELRRPALGLAPALRTAPPQQLLPIASQAEQRMPPLRTQPCSSSASSAPAPAATGPPPTLDASAMPNTRDLANGWLGGLMVRSTGSTSE